MENFAFDVILDSEDVSETKTKTGRKAIVRKFSYSPYDGEAHAYYTVRFMRDEDAIFFPNMFENLESAIKYAEESYE